MKAAKNIILLYLLLFKILVILSVLIDIRPSEDRVLPKRVPSYVTHLGFKSDTWPVCLLSFNINRSIRKYQESCRDSTPGLYDATPLNVLNI